MSDIATAWIGVAGDWQVTGLSLAADDGLQTAVVISLFTDRLAESDDELPTAGSGRRGWWGDAFADVQGDRIGSRLWLLSRSKQVASVLVQAQTYAAEALQHLVDDGVAQSIEVQAEVTRPEVLGLAVAIQRPAKPVARYRFELFWKGA